MVDTYNDAIVAVEDPLDILTAENQVVCGMETLIDQSVSYRLAKANRQYDCDDGPADPMAKVMCSCRLTARVMFVMIILGLVIPSGPKFIEEYVKFFGPKHKILNHIIINGLDETGLVTVSSNPNIYLSLPTPETHDLYVVQILKYIHDTHKYSPIHSFVVKRVDTKNEMWMVLSSWYSGGDSRATPIIQTFLSYTELNEILDTENLLNNQKTNSLFGAGNNLEGKLETIFFSREAIGNFVGTSHTDKHLYLYNINGF